MSLESKINNIRAGVLGSNDAILTTSGIIFSLSMTYNNKYLVLISAVANLVACSLSMSSGEFSSVSSQKDLEVSKIAEEKELLTSQRQEELSLISQYYQNKGINSETADSMAKQIDNPLKELVEIKDNIELDSYISPISASIYSFIFALFAGGFPLLMYLLLPMFNSYIVTIIGALISSLLVAFITSKLSKISFARQAGLSIIVIILCLLVNLACSFLL